MFAMIKQQFERGKINHLICGLIRDFIVSCKPTESIQPGKSTFNHPSKRFWRESICPVWSGADLDIEITLYILNKFPTVSAVDKSFSNRRPCMYSRAADMSAKDEAVAGDSNIAFYAFYLFVGIETVVALTVAPHDALGVMCHHRRRGGLPAFATNLHDELFDTMIQIPFQPPLAEIAVHGLLFGNGRGEAYATDIR